jgi:hypothetical protein
MAYALLTIPQDFQDGKPGWMHEGFKYIGCRGKFRHRIDKGVKTNTRKEYSIY